ncbi:mannitol dehydrogenase family protein [Carnimonas nigrificans]|uniref:mannitol dehydrogenase family protein n=1 Tax=Carnimonas nigrificans TaxID=64323 RepID=UPI00046ECC00|nr:mannitol dehydrogenase family protein [Carnimonas nigrificans]
MRYLNNDILATLANHPNVQLPTYDRTRLEVSIVHFGVGGFHRSHQAMYLDTLMCQSEEALKWGICGVGLMENDRRMQEVLDHQQGLYTLLVKKPDGDIDARVIGSLGEYLYAPDDPFAVIKRMAHPSTRIVSLTITEGGYNFDPATAQFDFDNPNVISDLEGYPQRTTFGLICSALDIRRQAGLDPFTVMSCDNIHNNGDIARDTFLAFAERKSKALAEWMALHVKFPNAMVDRITPATTDDDRRLVREKFGIEDAWPVVCEPFKQWVVEDSFTQGRPELEKVGVQYVDDVLPYELMKLRLLNCGHLAIGLLGYLAGFRYVHDVCEDPLFVDFLTRYMEREASPTLAPVPGVDLDEYRHQLIERFANPQIRDTLARLCAESSEKLPKWLVPVIRDQLASDGELHMCAIIVAGWARYAEGVDDQGEHYEIVDRQSDMVSAMAGLNDSKPDAFLKNVHWFGDLAEYERFHALYLEMLESLHSKGARATLEAYVYRDQ